MNFDPLSFVIGKHGDSGPVCDVVSYLIGRAVGTAGEVWQTLTDVAVATFTAVSNSLRELVIDVTPVQSGSGDPSPDNVRPISGWTGANIATVGINLWNEDWKVGHIVGGAEVSDGTYRIISKNYISVPSGKTIYLKFPTTTATYGLTLYGYDINKDYYGVVFDGRNNDAVTIPADVAYVRLQMFSAYGDKQSSVYHYDVSLNYPSTDTDYHSGHGGTISIPFPTPPGTIYGGTLTWLGGDQWKLTVTSVKANLGDLEWTLSSYTSVFYATVSDIEIGTAWAVSDVLCTQYKPVITVASTSEMDSRANESVAVRNTSAAIMVKDTAYSDVPTFQTAMSTANAQVVYNLATPVEYTFTIPDSEIKALLGDNNIFADCGNINTITYRES